MAAGWRLDGDALAAGPLRVALQRVGLAHWQPVGTLRSWGLAPLHRDGDRLCAPCGDAEALWLGAWLDPAGGRARLRLDDAATGAQADLAVPAGYAITALGGAPLAHPPRHWVLGLNGPDVPRLAIVLDLLPPAAWQALSGRSWQPLPPQPPPLPPRLG